MLSDMLLRDRSLRRTRCCVCCNELQRMGKVHAVGAEYFIQTQHLRALAVHAHTLAEADAHKRLNLKDLREASGISRHLSVPLVEYFDQIGLTKRDPSGPQLPPRPDATCSAAIGSPEITRRRIVPRWGVRSAKPGGAAQRSQVGSTPTLLRHPSRH